MKRNPQALAAWRSARKNKTSKDLILKIREKELLKLKGPCSNKECDLHYAHDGPCRCK